MITLHHSSNEYIVSFLIGHKTFIEKTEHHVHNGEHTKQETNTISTKLKLTEYKNSEIEIQCVKHHIRAH